MGTHPIFESDFDCLTVFRETKKCKSDSTKASWRPRLAMTFSLWSRPVKCPQCPFDRASISSNWVSPPLPPSPRRPDSWVVKFTAPSPVPERSRVKLPKSTPKKKGKNWPCKATHAVQPTICECRSCFRQEEGP